MIFKRNCALLAAANVRFSARSDVFTVSVIEGVVWFIFVMFKGGNADGVLPDSRYTERSISDTAKTGIQTFPDGKNFDGPNLSVLCNSFWDDSLPG